MSVPGCAGPVVEGAKRPTDMRSASVAERSDYRSRMDELVRAISTAGGVRAVAMVATGLVREAAERHATSPTATTALGRALMGGVLIAVGNQEGETLQFQFRGDGPLGPLTVIADASGGVRGFAARPQAAVPARSGRVDVAAAVGRGKLSVVRSHPSWRQPYTGIVELTSGEIADELARYLALSEQRRSAVALGLLLDTEGRCEAAGGWLVEALPGAEEEEIAQLEANTLALAHPSESVRDGAGADALLERLLAGLGSRGRERATPRFACRCSRERAIHAAGLLGREEALELAAQEAGLEVRCEFCGERYALRADDLASCGEEAGAPDPERERRERQ
jgi:molecular chaperone Hsp33